MLLQSKPCQWQLSQLQSCHWKRISVCIPSVSFIPPNQIDYLKRSCLSQTIGHNKIIYQAYLRTEKNSSVSLRPLLYIAEQSWLQLCIEIWTIKATKVSKHLLLLFDLFLASLGRFRSCVFLLFCFVVFFFFFFSFLLVFCNFCKYILYSVLLLHFFVSIVNFSNLKVFVLLCNQLFFLFHQFFNSLL